MGSTSDGGRTDEVEQLAEAAVETLAADAPWEIKRELAMLLSRLGKYGEALSIWVKIVEPQAADPDVRCLVNCAAHAGRHDVVLEAGRAARTAGLDDPYVSRLEPAALETYDPGEGVAILRNRLARDPDDSSARLGLMYLYVITGQNELLSTVSGPLPGADMISPRDGFLAVSILRYQGLVDEARKYAYALFRRHPDDPEAHRGLHVAVLDLTHPGPAYPAPEAVSIGTAVRYREEGDPRDHWLIVEDAPSPNPLQHEFSPEHPLVRRLLGKRVGESFVLAQGSIRDRVADIAEIRDKYAFRALESIESWQLLFPDEVGFQLVRLPTVTDSNGEARPDFAVFLPSLDERRRAVEEAEEFYRRAPISLHIFAQRSRSPLFEAMQHIAHRPGLVLRCRLGTPEEAEDARTHLNAAEVIVLDATAIQTLVMLGSESLLRDWSPRIIVPQAVIREIVSYIEITRMRTRSQSVMAREKDGYSRTEIDADSLHEKGLRYESLLATIRETCEVVDGRALADLEPDRRAELVGFLGQPGAEAFLLAGRPGHVLWTDDVSILEVSGSSAVPRIWTQEALWSRVEARILDSAEYNAASAKLVAWGYAGTEFNHFAIEAAGRVTGWDINRFPFKECLAAFSDTSIPLDVILGMAAHSLVEMHRQVDHPVRRDAVTIDLAERLAARTNSALAVRRLRDSIPVIFGLNVVRGMESARLLDNWLALRYPGI